MKINQRGDRVAEAAIVLLCIIYVIYLIINN